MQHADVLHTLRKCDALPMTHLTGTSGLRCLTFLKNTRLHMYPAEIQKLCSALVNKLMAAKLEPFDAIMSATVGLPLVASAGHRTPACTPDKLPPELTAIPAVKSGSRSLSF